MTEIKIEKVFNGYIVESLCNEHVFVDFQSMTDYLAEHFQESEYLMLRKIFSDEDKKR